MPNKLITLLKNLKFLSEINLREHASTTNILTEPHRLKAAVLRSFHEGQLELKPRILGYDETLDLLATTDASIARFGDGELAIACGSGIAFQDFDPLLQTRLKELLKNDCPGFYTGIPKVAFNISRANDALEEKQRNFINDFYLQHERQFLQLFNMEKVYIPTEITQMYMTFRDYDFAPYFEKIARIWKGKDIAVICGERTFGKIRRNIFDCAASVEYQYAPSKNAFAQYDEILTKAKRIDKAKTVVLILGPTAKPLAFDLYQSGYRALDLGHIAKDYDAFCKSSAKTPESIAEFFAPD